MKRGAAAFTLVGALTVAACGDDANDRALRARSMAATEARALGTPESASGSSTATPAETSETNETTDVSDPTRVVVAVIALDNSFRPDRIEIAVGVEVRWQNLGLNDHDVLSVRGDDWGVDIDGFAPGSEYAHVFDSPGEYHYFCSIHGTQSIGMNGTIVVTP